MQIKLPWVIPTSFRICHAYSSFTVRRGDVYLKRTAAVPLCASFGWSLVKNMEWKWILRFLRIADQRLEIFQISAGAFFLYWQGDLCISAPQCYRWIGAFEEKKKEKASTILFVVKTLHRRSKSSIGLRKISQEYYDEKVSGKGGFYSKWYLLESVQRVTHHSPFGIFRKKEKILEFAPFLIF